MNSRDIDKQISEIDKKLAELDKEENKTSNSLKKQIPDQTNEAIKTIREVVKELLEINELDLKEKENGNEHRNLILTIVSWFNYLKKENPDSKEFEEAKKLIISVGEKHTKLYDWCAELIEKPLPKYEPYINLSDVELNVSKSNEYEIKEDLKVIFDLDNVKEYINIEETGENLNNRFLKYKVIYKGKEYNNKLYYENYLPKWEIDDDCDYRITAMNAKKDNNNNYYVYFNVLTWRLIKIENNNIVNDIIKKIKELPVNTETSISQLIGPNALRDYSSQELVNITDEVLDKCKEENIELDFSKYANQKIGLLFNIPFIKK